MRVLRLCSVFETRSPQGAVAFDPVGGMQSHTAQLTRHLDRLGVGQVVLTSRPPGEPTERAVGNHGRVVRVGAGFSAFRQMWAAAAWREIRRGVTGGEPVDVVHAHLGEDLAVVPLALAAARRLEARLVLSVHTSLAHTFRSAGTWRQRTRGVGLRRLGGMLERGGARRADAVIALTPRLARLVQAAGLPAGRVYVVPSGVSADRFGPYNQRHTHTHTHTL